MAFKQALFGQVADKRYFMKRRELLEMVCNAVSGVYAPDEARAVAYEVALRLCGFSRTQAIVDPDADVVEYDAGRIAEVCRQLVDQRPLQYVTGVAEFYGLELEVGDGVLIPRPETEELVQWIVTDSAGCSGLKILDVGTGSGAIAVALALNMDAPDVTAVDVSATALDIARRNAALTGVNVSFAAADVLTHDDAFFNGVTAGSLDVVVSNPPYIPEHEYAVMRDNVRRYEPSCALFVPDDDPLLFYRVIGMRSMEMLASGGRLFFEIHEQFGAEVCRLLKGMGFEEVECREDMNGKPRMVRCVKR